MFKEKQKGFAHILLLVIIFGIGLVGYFGYKNGAVKLPTQKISSNCQLLPEVGSCRASFIKYFFNQKENKCSEFVWGGCHGVVPFETMQDCLNTCSASSKQVVPQSQKIEKIAWDTALKLIQECRVKSASQAHNLEVSLILKDGTNIITVEPKIDAINKEIGSIKNKCEDIIYATE